MVVFDPEPLNAKLVQLVLAQHGTEVVLVDTHSAALEELTERQIHGVVLEVDLPGFSGFELCAEMRTRGYTGPVLFVTRRRDALQARQSAFECGADDLLVKPFDPQELRLRLESVARRSVQMEQFVAGDTVRVGSAELRVTDMTFSVGGGRTVHLTPTEMRLLECLMRNSPRTIPRDTLIDRAWPDDFIADSNRVDVFVGRLRRKIQPNRSGANFVQTVRGVGYAFRVDEPNVVPLHVKLSTAGTPR